MDNLNKSQIVLFFPPEEYEEAALALSTFAFFMRPEIDPDEMNEFLIDALKEAEGEITLADLHEYALVAHATAFTNGKDIWQ